MREVSFLLRRSANPSSITSCSVTFGCASETVTQLPVPRQSQDRVRTHAAP